MTFYTSQSDRLTMCFELEADGCHHQRIHQRPCISDKYIATAGPSPMCQTRSPTRANYLLRGLLGSPQPGCWRV